SVNDSFDDLHAIQLTHAHADHPAVGVDHDGLLRARHKPSSMSRSTAIYDMSIWLKYDITTWFLHRLGIMARVMFNRLTDDDGPTGTAAAGRRFTPGPSLPSAQRAARTL